jgi:DNA-binding CsgD family transcriptional regulator
MSTLEPRDGGVAESAIASPYRFALRPLPQNGAATPAFSPAGAARPHTPAPSIRLSEHERSYLERGFTGLTRREREVVFELCSGGTNDGVAQRLGIALPTLRTHLMRLNQKLGTASKGDVLRLVTSELLRGYRTRQIAPSEPGATE